MYVIYLKITEEYIIYIYIYILVFLFLSVYVFLCVLYTSKNDLRIIIGHDEYYFL